MALETELKLHLAPADLLRLQRHPLLRKLSIGRARSQHLHSIYFDTPELVLHQQRMALRLRRDGQRWVQTLKGGGQASAGLHQRQEWETPVAGEQLDVAALQASGAALPPDLAASLRPVFVTTFKRQLRVLQFGGAEIELALDSGEIRSGAKTHLISELELELKSGEPLRLFELALLLLEIVPLTIEHTSKAEYGYRLFSGRQPGPGKGDFPLLPGKQPAMSALKRLAAACLSHVQDNLADALRGQDEEFLHQVRVGLRRLRVVLAAAGSLHADRRLEGLRQAVAASCIELGRLREWDVFVTQTLPALCARFPQQKAIERLIRLAQRQRQQVAAGLHQQLAGRDFQHVLLQLGAWMQSGPQQRGPSFADFSRRTLKKSARRVAKRGKGLQLADAQRLHQLRIACKKWRYALEMFAQSGNKQGKAILPALTELQTVLGKLNDLAVAERLLDELAWQPPAATAQEVAAWLLAERRVLGAAYKRAWQDMKRKEAHREQA